MIPKTASLFFDLISSVRFLRGVRVFAYGVLLAGLTSCGKGEDKFNFLDSPSSPTSSSNCAIASSFPSATSIRLSANGTAKTSFIVATTSTTSCSPAFALNGTAIASVAGVVELNGSDLSAGSNTLVATLVGTSGTETKTWTIIKNAPPTCSSQVPNSVGQNVVTGSTLAMSVTGTDSDTDPLTFAWTVNGTAPASGVLTPSTPASNVASAQFVASGSMAGAVAIAAAINDGYDTTSCQWTVNIATSCSLLGSSPSGSSLKVPAAATTSTPFAASVSDSNCAVRWTLNGTVLSGTAANRSFLSSQFSPGGNFVMATVTNGGTQQDKLWTVYKNAVPVCGTQTPAGSGAAVATGSAQAFAVDVTDPDADTMTFAWRLNGSAPGSHLTSSGTTATWTPLTTEIGLNTVSLLANDGYDQTTCAWSISALQPCSFSSFSPSSSTVRMLSSAAYQQTYSAAASNPSCSIAWRLNGTTISTSPVLQLTSGQLGAGSNTLVATATNAISSVNQSWTVIRNSKPVCSVQTPSSPASAVVNAPISLAATVSDAEGDPLTFSWTRNGLATGAELVSSSSSSLATGAFTPTSGMLGSSSIAVAASDGFESTSCPWTVNVVNSCVIASSYPAGTALRVSSIGSTQTTFGFTSSDSSCATAWTLNGSAISGTDPFRTVPSSTFSTGPNALVAVSSNGVSAGTRAWTVTKNSAPACASQTPAALGQNVVIGQAQNFTANATDGDADTLAFDWKLNGATAAGSILFVGTSGNSSIGQLTASGAMAGANSLVSTISDGVDQNTCSWNFNVATACTIVSGSPSNASPIRVSAAGSTSNTFAVTTSDASCLVTWRLNGSVISGQAASRQLLSSQLLNGANTLVATVTSGGSSSDQTWTVIKNSAPVCGSQSPAATGVSVASGSATAMSVAVSDSDADTLTYQWRLNGANVGASFAVAGASATWTPLNSEAGTNSVSLVANDGYDSTSCAWTMAVLQPCTISTSAPSGATARLASSGGATTFSAEPSGTSCAVAWTLNGSNVSGTQVLNMTSAQLSTGTNLLVATASNAVSSITRNWTVTRNSAPTCSAQTPSATGSTVVVGSSLALSATGSDADSDALTFAWRRNGNAAGAEIVTSSTGNISSASFTPTSPMAGSVSLAATISDGLESASCSWTTTVANACVISSFSPSASSLRMAAAPATATNFGVTVSDPSCALSWSLNGVASGTASFLNVTSGSLTTGSNSLSVVASNGISAGTRSWTVAKNSAPICASQSPSATGQNVVIGQAQNFTANAGDGDSDTLTFAWTLNGAVAAGSILSPVTSGSSATAAFTPGASLAGANSLAASISDGYDSAICSWNVAVATACSITGSAPSAAFARVPATGTTNNLFTVTLSDSNCAVAWTLNGNAISGTTASRGILSSDFSSGANTLVATVTSGGTPSSKTWTVLKNSPPICATFAPAQTGVSIPTVTASTFTGTVTDAEGDTVTYSWQLNGQATDSSIVASANSVAWTPTAGQIGSNSLTMRSNDGYDTTSCTWTTSVLAPCSIASSSPSGVTSRALSPNASTSVFSLTQAGTSCLTEWKLNGAILPTTTSVLSLTSVQLLSGTNSLVARSYNSVGEASKTWTVTKNSPPICSSQTPPSSGNSVAVGSALTFVANSSDADSDTLTFSWTRNGAAIGSELAVTSPSATSSQGVFTPTSPMAGSNAIVSTISDSYETGSCSWSSSALNTCVFVTQVPAGTTSRISANASSSASFFAVPNDVACNLSWTLNGSPVSGGTTAFLSVQSSILNSGANELIATASNSLTTATKTWSIRKNSPPSCLSQIPNVSGNTLNTGSRMGFTANVADTDGDSVTFSWFLGGVSNTTLFPSVTSGSLTSTGSLAAAPAQVGLGQTVLSSFYDGYDSGSCAWTLDIADQNQLVLNSCTPASSPVIVNSAGSGATQNLVVSASGAGLLYEWRRNGVVISGETGPVLAATSALAPGSYTYVATVTDAYANTRQCNWTVRRNAPPVLSSPSPAAGGTIRLSYLGTQAFSISASDVNSDPIAYSWTLSGAASTILPGTFSSSTLAPAGDLTKVGAHQVVVSVTDGYEVSTGTWPVEINQFSDECNAVYNTSAPNAVGRACVLIGSPSIGDGLDPSDGQTAIRLTPSAIALDSTGYFYADSANHIVGYFNSAGTAVSRLGTSVPAGKIKILVGNGGNGATPDITLNPGTTRNAIKLSRPEGVAYDSLNNVLYVSDYNNHRVIAVNSSGVGSVFIGTGATTNAAATNGDGNQGSTHVCQNPTGLRLVNHGGAQWLYVSCFSSHSIKRAVSDTSSVNYGKTYVFVGRLSAAGATSAGLADGVTGGTGYAQVNGPWALSDDGAGNIYWAEQAAMRVRGATSGGTGLTLNLGLTTSPAAGANSLLLRVTDSAGTLTAASTSNFEARVQSGTPSRLAIVGPNSIANGHCTPMAVSLQNSSAQPLAIGSSTVVSLSGAGAGGAFFADAACSLATTTGTIPANTSSWSFYYGSTTNGTPTLAASSGTYTSATSAGTVVAASVATKLAIFTTATMPFSECIPVIFQAQNASNVASIIGAPRVILLSTNNLGTFYSNAACSSAPITAVTLGASQSTAIAWYARTVSANGNETFGIAGVSGRNGATPSAVNSFVDVGATMFKAPRGLEVLTNGSGVVTGFFVGNHDDHSIVFLNLTGASRIMGGRTVPNNQTGVIAGNGAAGFTGDGQIASNTRLNVVGGLTLNSARTTLNLADISNARIRQVDISIGSGLITTLLGAGRPRGTYVSDFAVAATAAVMNNPTGVVIDRIGRKLYLSDASNGRIRWVDLLTGDFSTLFGAGVGTPGDIQETNPFMRSPRSLQLVTSGSANFLVYGDNQGTAGASTSCIVRGFNLSNIVGSLFNVTIDDRNVGTLAGNVTNGCNTWTGGGINSDGMSALNANISYPDGMIVASGTMYIASTNDHCILRVEPGGSLSRAIGTCGAPGSADGIGTSAAVNNPYGLAVDPQSAGSANFFFVDQYTSANGALRYVNVTSNTISFFQGTVTVNPGSPASPTVKTLASFTPSGTQSRLTAIAAFSNQICFASGTAGDQNTGAHVVKCLDRVTSDGSSSSLRAGPLESSTSSPRGGTTLGREQENQPASSILLSTPWGLDFDGDGNLYITERNAHQLRMIRRWYTP